MTYDNDNQPKRARLGEARAFVDDVVARSTELKECVFWPFYKDRKGYACFTINNQPQHVHRYICIETNGPPPSDLHQAAHTCGNGNKGCVSPFCLRWATQQENEADKIIHGTKLMGELVGDAKITTEIARQIHVQRKLGITSDEIAKAFGIKGQQVRRITTGERWHHIHPDNDPITREMVSQTSSEKKSLDCRIKATDDQIRHAHVMRFGGSTFASIARFLDMEPGQARRIITGERRKSLHPDNDEITAAMIKKVA